MDEEQSGKIKVVDKRRFNETGESNPDSDETIVNSSDNKANHDNSKVQSSTIVDSQSGNVDEQIDFSSFVVSLATQTLVMLGEMPHPETRLTVTNLDAAKQTIDIIALIKEKTKGNLSKQEENLIQEILTSLRLAFVNKVNP
jgi:hypothetical protein